MKSFKKMRENMVDGQIHTNGVVDEAILNSFLTVPRELFVPEKLQHVSYADENVDIGQGRYLIEPMVHAKMLQQVGVRSDDVVLDIGCGYGYSSAILSSLVTTVIAVEHNKRHCEKAKRVWEKLDLCNIVLVEDALQGGAPEHAPYSLIVINGAVPEVPEAFLDQLDLNGRLVAVVQDAGSVQGQAKLYMKDDQGYVSSIALFDAGIPVLEEFKKEPEFVF